jgi:hypothetical protein
MYSIVRVASASLGGCFTASEATPVSLRPANRPSVCPSIHPPIHVKVFLCPVLSGVQNSLALFEDSQASPTCPDNSTLT